MDGLLEWLLPCMSDGTRATFTVTGLLVRIVQQFKVVIARQADLASERYIDSDDASFRHTAADML